MKIAFEYDGFFGGMHPLLSKTVIINLATIVAEILTAPQLGEIVPAEYRGYIAITNTVINIWLRSAGGGQPLDWSKLVSAITPLFKKR